MDNPPLRCLLVTDFNPANLAGPLENDLDFPALAVAEAPLGQVIPVLAAADHPAWAEAVDGAFVWARPQGVSAAFDRLLAHEAVAREELLSDVDAFADAVLAAAARVKFLFVATWAVEPARRGMGMADWRAGLGVAHALAEMNLRLAARLADAGNVLLLDAARWLAADTGLAGAKLWHQAKVPFTNAVFAEAARDVKAAWRGALGQARKLIIVDLDDTLWGGIVGDVGWEALRLGGHDPVGEAHAEFQHALKALTRRGIVLAIVSKNDEAVALEAIRSHPEMALRAEDFAGWRINWRDKAANVAELAAELNLGLQSVVFLDDNPAERARVREALPEVLVPDWPESPMLYAATLRALRCFDTPALSREDTERARAYTTERARTELKNQVGSIEEWLLGLGLVVTVEPLSPATLARATQLLNKTNQFNLATRRLSEAELAAWAAQPGRGCWTFRVTDRFGDAGLTGLASLEVTGGKAQVVDFLLSCRVLGRRVEETMTAWLVEQAQARGAGEITAELLPTAKNRPCQEFWKRSGFTKPRENRFHWDATKTFARPDAVRVETTSP